MEAFPLIRLQDICKRNNVVLAYVFGSVAEGKAGPLSDFDLAVLFSKNVSPEQYPKLESIIADDIKKVVRYDHIDVINLATARNPVLQHRAVLGGKLIFVTDENIRSALQKRVLESYEDTKYLRNTTYERMKKRIQTKDFGTAKFSPRQEAMLQKYVRR